MEKQNLIKITQSLKELFDAFELLEIKGKSQALLVTRMATALEKNIIDLDKEIKEMEEKK